MTKKEMNESIVELQRETAIHETIIILTRDKLPKVKELAQLIVDKVILTMKPIQIKKFKKKVVS